MSESNLFVKPSPQQQQAPAQTKAPQGMINYGRWTKTEQQLFVEGLSRYGKDWKVISEMIKTRNVIQIRTHAQKYFQRLAKQTGGPVMSTSRKDDASGSAGGGGVPLMSDRDRDRGHSVEMEVEYNLRHKRVFTEIDLSAEMGREAEVRAAKQRKLSGYMSPSTIAAATLLIAPRFTDKISQERLTWAADTIANYIKT